MGAGAGNGWGKSKFVIAFLTAVCFPSMAPAAFTQHPMISNWPHPKRARIISTPKEVEEIGSIQTAIVDLFPKGRYEAKSKGKHYPSQLKTETGWIIDIMTYEQDKGEFAGPDIGLTIFNEPMPEDIWKESLMRARAGGIVLFAMTSLLENPWVVDGILNRADGKDIRVRYGSSEENCKQHGKCGHLDHDQIEKILAQYEPDEREARMTGKPLSLSGAIYKGFSREIHVAKEDIIPPSHDVAHYMAVDPAIGKPLAVIWSYIDLAGVLHIYDEWPEVPFEGSKDSNLTVQDYVALFRGREGNRPIQNRILDRHFGNQRQTLGGLTLRQEFAEKGLDFRDSYKVAEVGPEVETGILKVKDFLRWDRTKERDALNRPKLIISPKCKNTIASFERWARDPKTAKPQEAFKDFADVVRYTVMANPEVERPRNWDQQTRAHYGVNT